MGEKIELLRTNNLLEALNSSNLEKNSVFCYLRSEIEKNLSFPLKSSALYINLYKLLVEVVNTRSPSLQSSLLAKILSWYHSKVSKNVPLKASSTPRPVKANIESDKQDFKSFKA